MWYNKDNMEKLYKSREWLFDNYVRQEKSMPVMAREAGCVQGTIYGWLHKLNIPVRSRGEGIFLARRNFLAISPELLEFLEGELLGDGCVLMNGNRSALYAHGSKYKEYVIWLSDQLKGLGIEQVGKINKFTNKQNGGVSYHYCSKAYPALVAIRQRWYPEGKKIIPKDLTLTPIMARQWYIGDGGLCQYRGRRPNITFYTSGLDIDSVNYLIEQLRQHGLNATRQPAENVIGLSVHSVRDFLAWIGPSPIQCYDYKWGCNDV